MNGKISADVGTSCIHFVGRAFTNEHRGPNWLAMAIAAMPCFPFANRHVGQRRPSIPVHRYDGVSPTSWAINSRFKDSPKA